MICICWWLIMVNAVEESSTTRQRSNRPPFGWSITIIDIIHKKAIQSTNLRMMVEPSIMDCFILFLSLKTRQWLAASATQFYEVNLVRICSPSGHQDYNLFEFSTHALKTWVYQLLKMAVWPSSTTRTLQSHRLNAIGLIPDGTWTVVCKLPHWCWCGDRCGMPRWMRRSSILYEQEAAQLQKKP